MYQRLNKGMTLIEVMVVIILIAMVSMFAISMVRQRATVVLEDRTTVEMKFWLEAAMAYYVRNDKWPSHLDQLSMSIDPSQRFFSSGAMCSPWPGSGNSDCPNKALYMGQGYTQYFTVSVETPNIGIAKRIAGRLPQAEVSKGKVSASVGRPGYYKGWPITAGILSGDSDNEERRLFLPKCPEGYEAHYMMAPNYQSTGYLSYSPGNDQFHTSLGVSIDLGRGDLEYDSDKDRYYVKVVDKVHSPDASEYKRSYYMTFCLPQGQWIPKEDSEDKSTKKENQCSSDWMNYNSPFGSPCR